MPIELAADLTKSDYAAFRRFAMFRFRKIWLIYVLVGGFVAWTSYPGADPEAGLSVTSGVLAAIVMGLIAVCLSALVGWLLLALLPNRPRAIVGKHVFRLSDSEFQETNDIGSTTVRLDMLRRHETAKHIFLVTPMHVAFVIPKRDLDATPDFSRLLAERVRHA
jgi:hypothetical protein